MKIRLNKYLSECGIASRRNSEQFIKDGRIEVNGKVVIELSTKVEPGKDIIVFDGDIVNPEKKIYYLLNKPKGTITSTKDEKKRKTVLDIIRSNKKVFPVGRLDYNTTGVLFLTNDGEFANLLLHPKNKIPRQYDVMLDSPLSKEDKLKLLKGLFIERRPGKFDEITFVKNNNFKFIKVKVSEGRNHFVKRMFGFLGYNVMQLHRSSYAGVKLGDLPPGSYRRMSDNEILNIRKKFNG